VTSREYPSEEIGTKVTSVRFRMDKVTHTDEGVADDPS
jgi:hypothetical protein